MTVQVFSSFEYVEVKDVQRLDGYLTFVKHHKVKLVSMSFTIRTTNYRSVVHPYGLVKSRGSDPRRIHSVELPKDELYLTAAGLSDPLAAVILVAQFTEEFSSLLSLLLVSKQYFDGIPEEWTPEEELVTQVKETRTRLL